MNVGVKMPRSAGLASPPAACPGGHPFGLILRAAGGAAGLRHLLPAAHHQGRVGGGRLLLPSVQRDVLSGGTIILDRQPYRPSESNLCLLAATGPEWRGDSRARPRVLTLCTRPFPILRGGEGTWRHLNTDEFGSDGAQAQSQLLWHLLRQARRLARLNVLCQVSLAPYL